MIVYLITCSVTGQQYVGQHKTDNLTRYWRQNVAAALRGERWKPLLFNAIKKYGIDAFVAETIVRVESKEEMDRYEIGLIKALGTKKPGGYNLTDGGDGVRGLTEESKEKLRSALRGNKHTLGFKHTELARKHMTEARHRQKRKPTTEETKEKLRVALKGRKRPPRSEAWKHNLAASIRKGGHLYGNKHAAGGKWNLGRKRSEETKRKIAIGHKGRPLSEEHKRKISEGLRNWKVMQNA